MANIYTASDRDLLKGSGATIVVTIKIKHDWRVAVGLWLVKQGCRLAGLNYRNSRRRKS